MDKVQRFPMKNEFKLIKQIGKGSFSSVWLAKCMLTNNHVAIKIIPKNILKNKNHAYELIEKEAGIHKQLLHKNIAMFYKIYETEENSLMMMEYVKGNNLYNITNSMRKNGFPLIESDIRKYFIQLLSAVNYLHSELHIIHRDLKLDNIMIDVNDNAKIIDFGLSSYIDDHDELKESRGSPRYAAPEIFLKLESTTAVDMWSLGIILYYCFTGYFPFDSENSSSELVSKILFEKFEFTDNMDHKVRSLLRGLLRKNPNKRITCAEAMQHPWITDSDSNHEATNENANAKEIFTEDYKTNDQLDENIQNSQINDNQFFSKKENISDNTTIQTSNLNFSVSSKMTKYSIPNRHQYPHLKRKKSIQTSKSTFLEENLKKKSNISPTKITQHSNYRKAKTQKQ